MKKFISKMILTCVYLASLNSKAIDKMSAVTNQINDVIQVYNTNIQNHNKTLVVFDIDNTLLKLKDDLGSEHWFLWQKQFIENKITSLPAVVNSVEDLLTVQSWIYNERQMEWTDMQIKSWFENLRQQDTQIITLTSRNFETIPSTLREMQRLGVPLSNNKDLNAISLATPYLPYDLNHLSEFQLTADDVKRFHLENPKEVVFKNGVLFTQGQHKGIMLKVFLAKLQKQLNFENIFFVDDRIHHIEGMREVFKNESSNMYTFNYTKSLEWIRKFTDGAKINVQMDWCQFAATAMSTSVHINTCD